MNALFVSWFWLDTRFMVMVDRTLNLESLFFSHRLFVCLFVSGTIIYAYDSSGTDFNGHPRHSHELVTTPQYVAKLAVTSSCEI
jgi:hypothetical protein